MRGVSLLELLLGFVIGSLVLTAAGRLALAARRFWFAEREAIEARHALRAGAAILTAELRGVSPAAGDLLRGSDTAVTLRATRGLFRTCLVAGGGSDLTVRRDELLAPGVPSAGQDSVLVFLAAERDSADRWLHAGLPGVSASSCPDGSRAWRFTLAASDPAPFAALTPGAPVRLFEIVTYRLYPDGAGGWWLGVRSWRGGSWTTTSPVAGPFKARTGLSLAYHTASGERAHPDTSLRAIGITLRATGSRPIRAAGWRMGIRADSLVTMVAPRNR